MKLINSSLSEADGESATITLNPILYSHLMNKAIVGVLVAFLTTACHPSPNDSTPAPPGSGKPTSDLTSANPGKPVGNMSVLSEFVKCVADGTFNLETFVYAYNEQGYPTQKIHNGAGDTLASTYTY